MTAGGSTTMKVVEDELVMEEWIEVGDYIHMP